MLVRDVNRTCIRFSSKFSDIVYNIRLTLVFFLYYVPVEYSGLLKVTKVSFSHPISNTNILNLVDSWSKTINPFDPINNSDWSPISFRNLSCQWPTQTWFSVQIMIWTDILYLCKLLGFSVTSKLTFTTWTVARSDVNRLQLADWLCKILKYLKFISVWVQI